MNENLEFDYTVTKKPEGKYRLHRFLMIIGYIVFGATYFFGLFYAHFYPLMAFVILLEWILVFFTWRYVSLEYRYETVSGAIRFYHVFGGKKKKLVLEKRIKEFTEIGNVDSEAQARLSAVNFDAEYSFVRSKKDNADKYYAIFENEGKKCVVYFIAPEQTLKILRFYNQSAR